jgi:hypothetical protein
MLPPFSGSKNKPSKQQATPDCLLVMLQQTCGRQVLCIKRLVTGSHPNACTEMGNVEEGSSQRENESRSEDKCVALCTCGAKISVTCASPTPTALPAAGLLSRWCPAFTFFLTFKNLTAQINYSSHFCVNETNMQGDNAVVFTANRKGNGGSFFHAAAVRKPICRWSKSQKLSCRQRSVVGTKLLTGCLYGTESSLRSWLSLSWSVNCPTLTQQQTSNTVSCIVASRCTRLTFY